MANLIVSAVSTFDNKGLKKGKKEISTFEKQVKSFAKIFATAFSVKALTNYSKKAVQAFMADEKAAKSLEQQLKNTGFQFSSPSVELYIANLQKTTGVLDDELRPAFQQLLTITGSITLSQDALNTAMNVSAATGRSLSQVTTALSRAYAGNTTGLSRLGAGLDKALLKTGDMDKIMAELNKKFAGQSAARLGTYAGKMSLLAAAAADAEEIIGKGILDSLTLLSDDNTIDSLTTGMEDFATAISEVVVGLGQVGSKLKDLTNVPGVGNIFDVRNIPVIGAYIGGLRQIGRGAMPQQDRGGQERTAGRINAQQRKLEAQAIKNTVTLRKAEIDQLKKKTAVDQLKDKFDLERIGITAALNAATDEEVKLRLRSQLAILDNNEALAKKLLAEMEAAEGLKKFTDELASSTDKFSTMVSKLVNEFMAMGLSLQEASALAHMSARYQAQADAFAAGGSVGGSVGGMGIPSSRAPLNKIPSGAINPQQQFTSSAILADLLVPATVKQSEAIMASMSARYQAQADAYFAKQQEIKLTIDTSSTNDRFSQLIAESIQSATKTGLSTSPIGAIP
jgi:hypothetical protein